MRFGANHYIIIATNSSIQALECLDYGCNFSPLGEVEAVQIKVVVYLEKLHCRFPERQLFSIQFFDT